MKSFKVDAEKTEADKATLGGDHHRPSQQPQTRRPDRALRLCEANIWKIDDIKGSPDGEAWSIRKMLTNALKS